MYNYCISRPFDLFVIIVDIGDNFAHLSQKWSRPICLPQSATGCRMWRTQWWCMTRGRKNIFGIRFRGWICFIDSKIRRWGSYWSSPYFLDLLASFNSLWLILVWAIVLYDRINYKRLTDNVTHNFCAHAFCGQKLNIVELVSSDALLCAWYLFEHINNIC